MTSRTEQLFVDKMVAEGWEVHRNGYPDYLCTKNKEVLLVEVKYNKKDALKKHQVEMLKLLTNNTLSALVWTPETSFVSINEFQNLYQSQDARGKFRQDKPLSLCQLRSAYGMILLLKKILPAKYHRKIDLKYGRSKCKPKARRQAQENQNANDSLNGD